MEVYAFSLTDGALKYRLQHVVRVTGAYSPRVAMDCAYGKLYVGAYDGMMYATTSKWRCRMGFSSGNSGLKLRMVLGVFPWHSLAMTMLMAKSLLPTGEHSPKVHYTTAKQMTSLTRTQCEPVWTLQGWWLGRVSRRYMLLNGYDGRIYSTVKVKCNNVTATPGLGQAVGGSILIEGTFSTNLLANLTLQCVYADSMTHGWILVLQLPMPTNTRCSSET
jgi:hypothetical protein